MTNKYDKILDELREDDSGSGVSSFNALTGAVVLAAGSNITLTPSGNTITIAATAAAAAAISLTGTTLATNVVTSSLTSLGTLTSLTMGGTLAMGANSITMTGSIAATDARVTKGWFTDVESTNMYTVGGTSLSSTFAAIAQTMFIGTTSVAINRASAGLTLAGITLTTPVLGVATATSLNGNTFTTGTYTLTGVAGKTLTFNKSITLDGTDSTTMTFPSTSATIARTDAANTFTGIQTFNTPIATGSVATMTATVGGGVPTPPNNTTTFLRGDGTFAAPSSGGTTFTVLEAGNLGDVMTYTAMQAFADNSDNHSFGKINDSGNGGKKAGFRNVGSGASMSSLHMALRKIGSPSDNATFRVETDNAGSPSGTLANANATATVAGSGLTGSYVDTTITFAGAFTLSANTQYWLVCYRDGSESDTNYYQFNVQPLTSNPTGLGYKNNTGSWGTIDYTFRSWISSAAGFITSGVIKNRGAGFGGGAIGLAQANYTLGSTVTLVTPGNVITGMSGLLAGYGYKADGSGTAGGLSSAVTLDGITGANAIYAIIALTTTTAYVAFRTA